MADRDDDGAISTARTVHATSPALAREAPPEAWTLEALGALQNSAAASSGGIRLGPVLGEGGMGVVLSAQQTALGRDVAVKTLREHEVDDLAMGKLLREALVTGALEHPNIVPVYDLGLDAKGTPLLVLKRISGMVWSDLMRDPALVKARFGVADPLEWNVRILMQVANAIHFAHLRKIVHRDIKPENVMLGEHGEVYVLDWGIAVALEDDGTHRFPLASEATEMSGTMVYMPPEAFQGAVASVRTDVYLLGATLYEIVAGRPPHLGERLPAIIASARAGPETPEGAPPGLVSIWSRAMARSPEDRYASAEELRLALQAFLDHRGSAKLSERGARSLAELDAILAGEDALAEERRGDVYDTFLAARFAFLQALEEWGENEEARAGLRHATRAMFEYEVRMRDPKASRLLLSKIVPHDPEAEARLRALEAELAAEAARVNELARLGRTFDRSAGARGRGLLLSVFGVVWIVVPLAIGHFSPDNPHYGAMFPVPAALLGLTLLGGWLARGAMRQSVMNRAILGSAALAFACQMVLHVGSAAAGVTPDESQRILTLLWGIITAMMAVTVAPRLGLAAVGYLVAYLATSRWFSLRYEAMAFGNALLMVAAWWEWSARPGRNTVEGR